MSEEDEMVNALIEYTNKNPFENQLNIEPEAHYNHYGTRGVVDLFVRETEVLNYRRNNHYDHLYEVKSASAIREATGANELIRQYNRMRKTFYQDESRSHPSTVSFELTFVPSKTTVKHVVDNLQMYAEVNNSTLYDGPATSHERVFFRTSTPEDITPVHITTSLHGTPKDADDWAESIREVGGEHQPCGQAVLEILETL